MSVLVAPRTTAGSAGSAPTRPPGGRTCAVPAATGAPRQEVPNVARPVRQPSVRSRSRSVVSRTLTVGHVSGARDSRAAVFTSSPQAVEVYERGGWLPAAMLGWRHDGDGDCSAWVRVEFAGVVEDAWVELTRLRLPESPARHLALARAPRGIPEARPGHPAADADPAETQQLPLVRDSDAPAGGRRVPPGGGRRRAPEAVGSAPALSAPTMSAPTTSALPSQDADQAGAIPGRHRAPAEEGRHRADDTGMLAAVAAGAPAPSVPAPRNGAPSVPNGDPRVAPPARSDLPPAGPVVRGNTVRDLEAGRLTRPMRLDEGVGSARRARRSALSV